MAGNGDRGGFLSSLARLDNRLLWGLVAGAVALLSAWFALLPWLPATLGTPGSPLLYIIGVVGALLLLLSLGFVYAKRAGRAASPPGWLAAHVVGALTGSVLVAIHSTGSLRHPPALLFLVLIALAVLGVWARTRGARHMAGVFSSRREGFAPPDPALQERLRGIIAAKTALLARLEPGAAEGTFSLRAGHWLRHPDRAWRFRRLAAAERRLVGAHRTLAPSHGLWRRAHIGLALLFVAGLAAHVVTVTFFAGYVAGGKPITWWHLAAW